MTETIIDLHPHVISPDTDRYPQAPIGGTRSDWSAKRPFPVEKYLAEMDGAGVAKAAFVQSSTTYGYDNSYVADCVMTAPARFIGIYSVNIAASDAVATIEGWRKRGMAGLRLFGAGLAYTTDGKWMIAPETYPVWEHMASIGMTVSVQTVTGGLPVVEEILERFPGVTVLLDHLARPDLSDGAPYAAAAPLWRLARFRNLHLKITPRTCDRALAEPATPESFFGKLIAEYGADRLCWGSNYPAENATLAALVEKTCRCLASLDEADRTAIWSGTALRLFPQLTASSSGRDTE